MFFDELGPPWPKHFCTDANAVEQFLVSEVQVHHTANDALYTEQNPNKAAQYSWQRNGWSPFLLKSLTAYSKGWVRLEGVIANTGRRLVLYASRNASFSTTYPIFVRPYTNGLHVLSSFKQEKYSQETILTAAIAEENPPGARSWLEHEALKPLIIWFLLCTKLPSNPFDLRDKDRFGTSRWVADPPQFYASILRLIGKGQKNTSEMEQSALYKDLNALKKLLDTKR